jgi:hypothetical protein
MKSSLVKLGVMLIFIGFAVFTYAKVWGEDWELLEKMEVTKFYSDKKDITHSPPKIFKVWIKQVYTAKSQMGMISVVRPHYENLSYSIKSFEIACMSKLTRFLTITYYSENGDLLGLENPPDKWESIPPNSMFDAIYKLVCK